MSVSGVPAGLGSELVRKTRRGGGEAATRGSREGADGRKRGRPKVFNGSSIHRGGGQGSFELTWQGVVVKGCKRNTKETLNT
jgi:hypothetical protein